MDIVKVFTKYDTPYQKIIVQRVREIKPIPIESGDIISFNDSAFINDEYYATKIEEGLEGVRFIHYRR